MTFIIIASICIGINLGGMLYGDNPKKLIFALTICVIALILNLISY